MRETKEGNLLFEIREENGVDIIKDIISNEVETEDVRVSELKVYPKRRQ